ncbi:MAG TPA: tRNA uridine-5-carboxymethylaminomethyl(34) synthesis GTPase MnmE [Petrotogaceae bacterium]|nr:tRNA uridine-5-carboxymethylaminomethyl(34) synthesis GTPase MnmE [Petrotogaceae bacterium]HQI78637.1 tRNA uridine-5-carboxymethylaminomethyl(34) synthesis GTPase MnmE [Petrotogaceae bacterium]
MIFDTITAISSPMGQGAVAVVRVSGNESRNIAEKIFNKKNPSTKHMYYGMLYDGSILIDEVTWVFHESPSSFTGEDMLEVFCHGGRLITQKVFETIIKSGARQALPGEFSFRAVLNGKMDLIKAESINDMINAKTDNALKVASANLSNGVSVQIKEIKEMLMYFAASIEVELDYPEDFEQDDSSEKISYLKQIISKTENILKNAQNGIAAVQGVKTCIVGKPNSGKSTLLNSLLKTERAIVSPFAGTTRDTIEENISLFGINIRLIDTAGIRQTDNEIENLGIERSKKAIEQSEMIIFVIDGETGFTNEDKELYDFIAARGKDNVILAINKKDSTSFIKCEVPSFITWKTVEISALKNDISELENVMYSMLCDKVEINEPVLTNLRQKQALMNSYEAMLAANSSYMQGYTSDVVMIDIRKAIQAINELIGADYTQDLLESIFSNFCVGK